jgi:hypothetical protein
MGSLGECCGGVGVWGAGVLPAHSVRPRGYSRKRRTAMLDALHPVLPAVWHLASFCCISSYRAVHVAVAYVCLCRTGSCVSLTTWWGG